MKMSLPILTYNVIKKAPIVSLKGQPVLLYTQQHTSLLHALEAKKVKVFSECRNGFCGACKTKVLSGKVKYHTDPLVELESDECLPCCCHPDSDVDLELSSQGADIFPVRQTLNTQERVDNDNNVKTR
ncbi:MULTISPECIES: class I ribonucleotide reductase maintenance protein YfaE [Shewanella]|uniref:class I ribonucleotide reductase maintenance protein YfaE n=1 Tax=Shewanella TaxID=22 RepID=UPI000686B06F|nr:MULTISPECIES: class I ribonucleotide reductase maintenance protein YfaE [Shewanella]QLE87807.1 2Fe-2S ferredoxin-like protein [Shewanella sp. Scap07]